jgi:quercetin dioxygenase-like cupin family protein
MSQPTTARPGTPQRQYLFGPERLRATILTTGAETDGRLDLTDGVLPPGATVPLHLHTRYEERLFVVTGSLTVWAGPDKLTLRAGDYYHVPLNTPHTFQAGPEGARSLNISSPAGFAETITRAGTPAQLASPDTEFDLDLLTAVAAELGDVVLGPPGTTPTDVTNRDGA